ncbi:hypothetical protein EJV47_12775 [Hymenobacter gummosus]|uniref:histidine kinase n=1 Tax=Hymenobacter gummosus TaxID=1776032 RepID=A0A3S0HN85_9BACT|nr:histidine kinase dimerization/phosphoacceptor domain -containing protein [Hymenobacter gummosus]RTQ49682.1 hypothetical protein EJV47_12775 [Hymenobacter gummosus]
MPRRSLLLLCLALLGLPVLARAAAPADTSGLRQQWRTGFRLLLTDNDAALQLGRTVLNRARQAHYAPGVAQGNLLIAGVWRNKTEFDSALYYGQRALTLFEQQRDDAGRAATYTMMAQVYKRLGDAQGVRLFTRKGLAFGRQARALARAGRHYEQWCWASNVIGIIHRDLGRLDSAGVYYRESMQQAKAHPFEPSSLPVTYANYGQMLMNLGLDLNEAIGYMRRAIPLYRQQGHRNGLEHAYRNLSAAYRLQGNLPRALATADSSLALGRSIGDPHRLINSLQMAYEANRAAGRYERAVELLEEWKNRADTLADVEVTRAVAKVDAAYEAGKKQEHIRQLAADNARKRQQLWLLGAGAGALLLLLAVSIGQHWVIRRNNAQLRLTNQLISDNHQRITEQADRLRVLMKELHHRVKNNLAIVSGLLRLQAKRLHDEGAVRAVREGQQRVEAMALVHQRLYQTDNVSTVDMQRYVTDLVESLMTAYGYDPADFDLTLTVQLPALDVEQAVPLGLILNELLTNAFKHAFPAVEQPSLRIYLARTRQGLLLEVHDNGPGFDTSSWQQKAGSFGRQLIVSLSEQVGGTVTCTAHKGTLCRLLIPAEPEQPPVGQAAQKARPA